MNGKVRAMYRTILCFTLVSLSFVSFFASHCVAATRTLTLFAEPNLAPALTEISRLYSTATSSTISVEYGNSEDMVRRIEDGESSDIFISSHKNWQDELKLKGLIDIYNINHFADDNLVIATSAKNSKLPKEFAQSKTSFIQALTTLDKNRLNLVVDNNTTSLGLHSNNAIDSKKFHKMKIFKKLPEDVSTAEDIITKNPNTYSLMLSSEVYDNDSFLIIAKDQRIAVFYQALVIAGENMENARQFSNFLKSKKSQKILQKYGFVTSYQN